MALTTVPRLFLLFLCAIWTILHPAQAERSEAPASGGQYSQTLTRIAFGSCAKQYLPQPILDTIVKAEPDIFIYLGDNIYSDTEDMNIMRRNYRQLEEKETFRHLWASTTVLATWDDHDYGQNDGGKYYSQKDAAKEVFLEFWREPKDSPRFTHEGVYADYLFGEKGKRVQILLLDTRYFRDNVERNWWRLALSDIGVPYPAKYKPQNNPEKTLLGKSQWQWLEQQLKKDADLRIIVSSIPFLTNFNGYENWALFPHEREKLFDLIKTTHANNVVVISGNVHYAEISKLNINDGYPIYDVTASGLTHSWKYTARNKNRIDGPFTEKHFGLFDIDWNTGTLYVMVIDLSGEIILLRSIRLKELTFQATK